MQLYALDDEGRLTGAHQAYKQQNYICMECSSRVRLRSGTHRRYHFYHVEPERSCRLHQKGMIHLQVQAYLYACLPAGDCRLELRMPAIKRIADVAWLSKKIVFEIQYSSITAEEVQQRLNDYSREGWMVVWILHDHRFNHLRVTAAEQLLRAFPHYFTNMNSQGEGVIYDQFDVVHKGLRLHKMAPLPVDLTQPYAFEGLAFSKHALRQVWQRSTQRKIFFAGDLCDEGLASSYLQQAKQKEELFYASHSLPKRVWRGLRRSLGKMFFSPYQALFRFLLERASRY